MNEKEMSDYILELRDRNEMPIDENDYYLLGDIAEYLLDIYEKKKVTNID